MTAALLIYSKSDCPLCLELRDELRRLRIAFTERDIRSDPEWYLRYRERVPVVVDPRGKEHDPPFTPGQLVAWAALCR